MANELRHKTVGTELTQSEFESVGGHEIESQATGDIVYASSATQLSRLGVGSNGNVLDLASGIPAWATDVCRIKTGTYTGDGEVSQAITGVGFQVKALWIAVRQTAEVSFTEREVLMTTDVIVDDIAAGAHLNFAVDNQVDLLDNGIIALGSDGFTVDDNGADEDPNTLNETYNYYALGLGG